MLRCRAIVSQVDASSTRSPLDVMLNFLEELGSTAASLHLSFDILSLTVGEIVEGGIASGSNHGRIYSRRRSLLVLLVALKLLEIRRIGRPNDTQFLFSIMCRRHTGHVNHQNSVNHNFLHITGF